MAKNYINQFEPNFFIKQGNEFVKIPKAATSLEVPEKLDNPLGWSNFKDISGTIQFQTKDSMLSKIMDAQTQLEQAIKKIQHNIYDYILEKVKTFFDKKNISFNKQNPDLSKIRVYTEIKENKKIYYLMFDFERICTIEYPNAFEIKQEENNKNKITVSSGVRIY